MVDKVQRIREEVEKIARSINPYIPDEEGKNSEYEAGRFAMVIQIMQIIDSLPKEPVSEDLEEAAMNYTVEAKGFPGIADETDKKVLKAFKSGWQTCKQQMMKDAVERTVHIDEDLCPFIRKYEMAYDIKKQIPDIKEGDKVKVIVIKED